MVINIDSAVSEDVLDDISKIDGVNNPKYVKLTV